MYVGSLRKGDIGIKNDLAILIILLVEIMFPDWDILVSLFIYDQELFKKLNEFIWEFRTLYNGKYYRLLSFWDKSDGAWVVATHGFIKTTAKTPPKEIAKAEEIRAQYLENKKRTKKK
jgi:hypothetical protein